MPIVIPRQMPIVQECIAFANTMLQRTAMDIGNTLFLFISHISVYFHKMPAESFNLRYGFISLFRFPVAKADEGSVVTVFGRVTRIASRIDSVG